MCYTLNNREHAKKEKKYFTIPHRKKKNIHIYIYRNAENEKYIQKSIAC